MEPVHVGRVRSADGGPEADRPNAPARALARALAYAQGLVEPIHVLQRLIGRFGSRLLFAKGKSFLTEAGYRKILSRTLFRLHLLRPEGLNPNKAPLSM